MLFSQIIFMSSWENVYRMKSMQETSFRGAGVYWRPRQDYISNQGQTRAEIA